MIERYRLLCGDDEAALHSHRGVARYRASCRRETPCLDLLRRPPTSQRVISRPRSSEIARRCTSFRHRLEHERTRLTNAGHLLAVGQVLFRHGEIRIEAELRWHQELRDALTDLAATRASRPEAAGRSKRRPAEW
jgi:hypothetical protein